MPVEKRVNVVQVIFLSVLILGATACSDPKKKTNDTAQIALLTTSFHTESDDNLEQLASQQLLKSLALAQSSWLAIVDKALYPNLQPFIDEQLHQKINTRLDDNDVFESELLLKRQIVSVLLQAELPANVQVLGSSLGSPIEASINIQDALNQTHDRLKQLQSDNQALSIRHSNGELKENKLTIEVYRELTQLDGSLKQEFQLRVLYETLIAYQKGIKQPQLDTVGFVDELQQNRLNQQDVASRLKIFESESALTTEVLTGIVAHKVHHIINESTPVHVCSPTNLSGETLNSTHQFNAQLAAQFNNFKGVSNSLLPSEPPSATLYLTSQWSSLPHDNVPSSKYNYQVYDQQGQVLAQGELSGVMPKGNWHHSKTDPNAIVVSYQLTTKSGKLPHFNPIALTENINHAIKTKLPNSKLLIQQNHCKPLLSMAKGNQQKAYGAAQWLHLDIETERKKIEFQNGQEKNITLARVTYQLSTGYDMSNIGKGASGQVFPSNQPEQDRILAINKAIQRLTVDVN